MSPVTFMGIDPAPRSTVSAVVPHYPLTTEHDDMLKRCIKHLRGAAETLVIVNDGIGFGRACNMGVAISQYDYVAIINNDTWMMDPLDPEQFPRDPDEYICGRARTWDLSWMAREDTVTFPRINGIEQEFTGAFLVIPRTVIDGPLGGQVYDERYEVGFWEDVDLWVRLKKADVKIEQLPYPVSHPSPGFTMRHMPPDTDSKNRLRFLEKHGSIPLKNWS